MLQLGQRAVVFPCGQRRHVLHARYVVEALARGTAPALLRCPAVSCGSQHPRWDPLEAAVQADPGLRNWAGRMGEGTIGDEDLDILRIGPPLDAVSMDDLGQRFVTEKKV